MKTGSSIVQDQKLQLLQSGCHVVLTHGVDLLMKSRDRLHFPG